MERKNALNSIINRAKFDCRRDGYPQIIYVSETDIKEGTCSFTRLYPELNLFDVKVENVKGVVYGQWINGCYWVKYYTKCTCKKEVEDFISRYKVRFMTD